MFGSGAMTVTLPILLIARSAFYAAAVGTAMLNAAEFLFAIEAILITPVTTDFDWFVSFSQKWISIPVFILPVNLLATFGTLWRTTKILTILLHLFCVAMIILSLNEAQIAPLVTGLNLNYTIL